MYCSYVSPEMNATIDVEPIIIGMSNFIRFFYHVVITCIQYASAEAHMVRGKHYFICKLKSKFKHK